MPTAPMSLQVSLADRSYPILIGEGLLNQSERLTPYLRRQAAVVTNTTVGEHYLEPLMAALTRLGIKAVPIVLPDGEAHKNWQTLNLVFDRLLQARCERSTTLIAGRLRAVNSRRTID